MAAFTPVVNPRPALELGNGPRECVLVASGAFTATAAQEFIVAGDGDIVAITINTSAAGSSPSTVPTVEFFDVASQTWIVLLTGSAITGTGHVILLVGPHATASANVAANTALYRLMRINMTHGNSTSHTYSISAAAI